MFLSLIIYSEFGGFHPSVVYDDYYSGFHFDDGCGTTAFWSTTQVISFIADFTPLIGDAKGFIEGIIGNDLLTGDPYSPIDRFLGLVLLTELRGAKAKVEGFEKLSVAKPMLRIYSIA